MISVKILNDSIISSNQSKTIKQNSKEEDKPINEKKVQSSVEQSIRQLDAVVDFRSHFVAIVEVFLAIAHGLVVKVKCVDDKTHFLGSRCIATIDHRILFELNSKKCIGQVVTGDSNCLPIVDLPIKLQCIF